jgi:Ca-activated chloride channel family protein
LPEALAPVSAGGAQAKVADFAKQVQQKPGDLEHNRNALEDRRYEKVSADDGKSEKPLVEAKDKKDAYDKARDALAKKRQADVQAGKLGVDLSLQMENLRNQSRLEYTAPRNVAGRNCIEIGGVWIDDGFDAKMPMVKVKAQSDAYFRILERQAKVKDVFQLGNHLVWVTPNGTALVIDTSEGKDKLSDEEIDKLFVAKK